MELDHAFIEHYRCPEDSAKFGLREQVSGVSGYFKFGPDTVCYGRVSVAYAADDVRRELHDALADVEFVDGKCMLSFNPSNSAENLRRERYVSDGNSERTETIGKGLVRKAYYAVRPLLPVAVRRHLQKFSLRGWDQVPFPRWPLDRSVDKTYDALMLLALEASGCDRIPFIWFWPEGKSACAIMTHDVETKAGLDFCGTLMDLNDSFGIKSSFQVVPVGRYRDPELVVEEIARRGFEPNVHDWNHDGHLFSDRETFLSRAPMINQTATQWGAHGFRSAVLYRNTEWFSDFTFSYDLSVPNVGHLDPQPGGCCTTFPYFIGEILELPLTTTQDYPLFHILRDYSIDLWKTQIGMIRQGHGLITLLVHPDYIIEKRARAVYCELLGYLAALGSDHEVWLALPREVNRWWRERSQMKLVRKDGRWEIEGPGKERARIAYAHRAGGQLAYSFE